MKPASEPASCCPALAASSSASAGRGGEGSEVAVGGVAVGGMGKGAEEEEEKARVSRERRRAIRAERKTTASCEGTAGSGGVVAASGVLVVAGGEVVAEAAGSGNRDRTLATAAGRATAAGAEMAVEAGAMVEAGEHECGTSVRRGRRRIEVFDMCTLEWAECEVTHEPAEGRNGRLRRLDGILLDAWPTHRPQPAGPAGGSLAGRREPAGRRGRGAHGGAAAAASSSSVAESRSDVEVNLASRPWRPLSKPASTAGLLEFLIACGGEPCDMKSVVKEWECERHAPQVVGSLEQRGLEQRECTYRGPEGETMDSKAEVAHSLGLLTRVDVLKDEEAKHAMCVRVEEARLAERAAYEMAAQSMRDAACAKQVIEESRRAAVASAEYLSVKAEARALDEEVGRLNKAAERPDRCWECAGCAKLKVGARRWLEEGFLYSSAFFTLRLSFTLRCLPLPCGHLPALPPCHPFSHPPCPPPGPPPRPSP